MPLVQAKCTNCGATLQVESTKDAAICPYCGAAYIVEKAVNYFNTTNSIRADVVNIYGGNSSDFVIRAGTLERYNGAASEVVIPNSVTAIGGSAFEHCSGLTSVTIPNSVTTIGGHAFSGCSGLTSVTIPNSVTTIGDSAFMYCSGLTSVTISNGVTTIGDSAFWGCTSLTNVTIPNSVTTIGGAAFHSCSGLTSVTIPNSVTTIGEGTGSVFNGCDRLTTINASEEWKREHWSCAEWSGVDLRPYRPEPKTTSKSSGGCYIATAVYGSYDCPQVWVLRRYRDNTLAETWYGRALIHIYYAISPALVRRFGPTRWFRSFWRKHLNKLVGRLKASGTEDTPYWDRTW